MAAAAELIETMRQIAPPGQDKLSDEAAKELLEPTHGLLEILGSTAKEEYERYVGVQGREIGVDDDALRDRLKDKTILVTGGTGCIGSALLRDLVEVKYGCRQIISVSRGDTKPNGYLTDKRVTYEFGVDIRNKAKLLSVFETFEPDVVFHLAALRDPGKCDLGPCAAVTTNLTGTRNILDAAYDYDVQRVVCSSTGKVVQPRPNGIYAGTKKAAEWLMAETAARHESLVSGVRFTHIFDNSIVHERILDWLRTGKPMRIHDPDIDFYVQSATEAAQLLLNASLGAKPHQLTLEAIRDLGMPVNLLDIALGAMATRGLVVPIYFNGREDGYREASWALYDPRTAGGVSPLINMLDAPQVTVASTSPDVDVFPFGFKPNHDVTAHIEAVEHVAATGNKAKTREAMRALSGVLLRANLQSAPPENLKRLEKLMSATKKMNDDQKALHAAVQNAIHQSTLGPGRFINPGWAE